MERKSQGVSCDETDEKMNRKSLETVFKRKEGGLALRWPNINKINMSK